MRAAGIPVRGLDSDGVRTSRPELRERDRRPRAWTGCCPRSTACRPSTWSAAPSATCCSAAGGRPRPRGRGRRRAPPARSPSGSAATCRRTSDSGTATVGAGRSTFDLATTRRETYAQPGALPGSQPAGAGRGPRAARLHDQRDGGRRCGRRARRACTTRTAGRATSRPRSSASCTTAASSTTRRGCCGRSATRPGWASQIDAATERLARDAVGSGALSTVTGRACATSCSTCCRARRPPPSGACTSWARPRALTRPRVDPTGRLRRARGGRDRRRPRAGRARRADAPDAHALATVARPVARPRPSATRSRARSRPRPRAHRLARTCGCPSLHALLHHEPPEALALALAWGAPATPSCACVATCARAARDHRRRPGGGRSVPESPAIACARADAAPQARRRGRPAATTSCGFALELAAGR